MPTRENIKPAIAAYMTFVLLGTLISVITACFNALSGHLNVGLTQIGFMISAMAVGRLSTIFISGIVSDRFGRKPVLILSMIFIASCYLLVPFTKDYYICLVLFGIAGMGHGMADSSATALIFDCFPDNPRGAVGLIQSFFCIGAMASPLISALLVENQMFFGLMFWLFTILSIITLICFVFISFPKPITKREVVPNEGFKKNSSKLILISITALAYSIVTTHLTTWSGTYAIDLDKTNEIGAINILTYFNIGCIIGAVIMSYIVKKIYPTKLLRLNCIALTLAMATYALTDIAIIFIFLWAGFFAGINYSLMLSVAGELFPQKKAAVSGIVMGFAAVGAIITPMFSGYLYQVYGINIAFNSIFVACALLILLCSILKFID